MRIEVLIAAAAICGMWVTAGTADAAKITTAVDLATVRARLLLSLVTLSDANRQAVIARADSFLASIRPDGSWADQDYADQNRERWKCGGHLPRVVALATAARQPGVTPDRQSAYAGAARNGLQFWLTSDPTNTNWWHNEIGVPMQIGEILIMLGEDAPEHLRQRGIELMRRSRWSKWTGQNLVWGTKIQITRSCISDDVQAASEAFARMYDEVRLAPGREEGIKADRSFFQHGPLLYSGGYGAGFAIDTSRLATLGAGTAFAIPADKLGLLASYVADGQAWMVRGSHWDHSVTGREIVRQGKNAASLARAADDLASLLPERRDELANLAARLRGEPGVVPLSGNRYFWCADYMAHVRPAWFTSARMYSARTKNTDGFINGENRQSHHLADGVTYVMLKGDEYEDIFPAWDWHKVPGSTVQQGTELDPTKVSRGGSESFVGGASDGNYGCATMDLATDKLRAQKSWFFFDEGFVALGAGISCPGGNSVVTTINQCLLRGEVKSGSAGTLSRGEHRVSAGEWIWHAQVAYVPLDASAIHVRNDVQTGSWSRIAPGSNEPVHRDVFSMWIDHGQRPVDSTYAYLVLPAISPEQTALAAVSLPVRILSNDRDLQAVRHEKAGITQAIFRKAGSVMAGNLKIAVDRPCALVIRPEAQQVSITVADPSEALAGLTVDVSTRLDAPGAEVLPDGSTRIKITLPEGLEAGKSVTITARIKGK